MQKPLQLSHIIPEVCMIVGTIAQGDEQNPDQKKKKEKNGQKM